MRILEPRENTFERSSPFAVCSKSHIYNNSMFKFHDIFYLEVHYGTNGLLSKVHYGTNWEIPTYYKTQHLWLTTA